MLHLSAIRIDGGTQTRDKISGEVVSEYAEAMRGGVKFPPVVVFYDGSEYWLADGFHRLHAALKAGKERIEVDVKQGTCRDAILFSVSANASHGLRRTNADKRRAVTVLLTDPEWSARSDRWIAEKCGVHHTFVGKVRDDQLGIEAPRLIWWPVLHGVILRVRPRRSAAAYREVWTEDGSPLLSISKRQRTALEAALAERTGQRIPVVLAMRYGRPSIQQGLEELREAGLERVLVLPLYPQYSATTTASIFDRVTEVLRRWRVLPELRFVNRYPEHPAYIRALADSVRHFQAEHGRPERLLVSFHGIPREYADKGDPYPRDCERTARALARELGLGEDDWLMTFQSRFGPKEWLKPYTDETLKAWGAGGVKRVQVMCPGFPTDCLETIEEIGDENREYFMEAGGEDYRYIPSLNDTAPHIDALVELIRGHAAGWLPAETRGASGRESAA